MPQTIYTRVWLESGGFGASYYYFNYKISPEFLFTVSQDLIQSVLIKQGEHMLFEETLPC